ncbi:MAG TPA: DUF192 domain-containing protein [Armatimonadota bacterium]|nr:DUF192 domain-containing protein [Armatimonadota bacterium]
MSGEQRQSVHNSRRGSTALVMNTTRETVLADRATIASNLWKLLVGLIPYRRLNPGDGMVFPRTGSIHTTGLKFEIDVLFLSRDGRIIGMKERVAPFRIAWAPRGSHTAIELPGGALSAGKCQIGDQVTVTSL